MELKKKYWYFVGASFFFFLALGALLLWYISSILSPATLTLLLTALQEQLGILAFFFLFLIIIVLLVINDIFQSYILPLYNLTEGTGLIASVNPGHRINVQGAREINVLGKAVNELADQLQDKQIRLGQVYQQTHQELQKEKNKLGRMVYLLPIGIIVCNIQGVIFLYNKKAKDLFLNMTQRSKVCPCSILGLGRSIMAHNHGYLFEHCMREIIARGQTAEGVSEYCFLVPGSDERILRVEAAPFRDEKGKKLQGYVFSLFDVSQDLNRQSRLKKLVHEFKDPSEKSLSRLSYPEMVPLQQISLEELINIVNRKLVFQGESELHYADAHLQKQVQVEIFFLVRVLLYLSREVARINGGMPIYVQGRKPGNAIALDLYWEGEALGQASLQEWHNDFYIGQRSGQSLSLQDILDWHRAELELSRVSSSGFAGLSLLFPDKEQSCKEAPTATSEQQVNGNGFYDFDLLKGSSIKVAQIWDKPLSQVPFTVFDTETTGLDARGGDEIISLSGIRIINGRILYEETFNQLINPRRSIPKESILIHGIKPEMLKDQPTIEEVLPLFKDFVQDTVLVAFNAEFDLEFFRLKEERTGIKLDNPVLDILLLSEVVHPAQKNHQLEAIASRLGTSIYSRHSSYGDALTTAEILIKLIPLLERKGFRTLRQASLICQKNMRG